MDYTEYSRLNSLNDNEKAGIIQMMSMDKFLFSKIILGDKELDMHYHVQTESPPFHYIINDDLEGLKIGEKYACVAPRGHAKTTLIDLIHPLFGITFNERWCKFLLMISESETQSTFNLETLGNEVEFNPKYKFFFGDRMGKAKWGSLQKDFITRFHNDRPNDMSRVLVRGVNQKCRGMKFGPFRPSAICDDFEGDGNSLTLGQRAKLRRWVNTVVINACDKGIFAAVGTIIDDESYLNRIAGSGAWTKGKYKIKGWKHRFFQGVIQDVEPGEFVGDGKEIIENGKPKVLWKSYKPYEELMNERERLKSEGDEQFWFQEIQNIPTTDAFRIFKMKDLRYWDGKHHYLEKENLHFLHINDKHHDDVTLPVNIFIGVDPASSEKITADYSVVMVIAVARNYDIYMLEYWREQADPMRCADMLWAMMDKYKPKAINIEKTGHEMLTPYMNRVSKQKGKFYSINPQEAYTNKIYRIMELQPMFGTHSIYSLETMSDFESEYSRFRKDGKSKKDTLDALRWAVQDMYPPEVMEKAKGEYESKPTPIGMDWETLELIY